MNVHNRVSICSVNFAGASLAELEAAWVTLGARRVSVPSALAFASGEDAAGAAVSRGGCTVETVSHRLRERPNSMQMTRTGRSRVKGCRAPSALPSEATRDRSAW
jgi:hypothetical protein